MTRTIISPLTLSLLCPLLALACDPEDIADSDAELPDDIEGEITPRSNQIPVACQSLTPAALQAPVDKMNEAIGLINEYIATTPESNYPTAGTLALGQINQAKSKITNYQAWLTSINHGNPFVYWVGATPFLEVTDSAHLLHGAAWWAYIAVANDEKEVARLSAKRVFEAQQLASEIGKQALLCAMEQYTNCGDGVLDANEACDDGNAVDGDGCSNTCESDGGTCGNSVVDPGEACDDGNEIDNDGCDLCSSRTPWPLQPQNPCEALTPAAIQRSVELTDEAIEFIDEYLTPPLVTNYTGAGQYTLDSLNQARSKITAHQTYLASIPHGIPFVSQEAVAAETFTAMKGAADWLRYGMWWGFVATAWDHTPSSRMSARRAADAQKLADHLARQALLCSMAPYALCSDGVVNGTEQCDDGNLIAGDGCSSTCTTESACPAVTAERGMYMWNEEILDSGNSAALVDELLDFAEAQSVNRIYFQAQGHIGTPQGRAKLTALIAEADARCIGVDLLFGAHDWFLPNMHSVPTGHLSNAIALVNSLTTAIPVRAHFDIEPHVYRLNENDPSDPTKWSNLSDTGRRQRLADLLTLYTTLKSTRDQAGVNLELTVAMPFWYHSQTYSAITVNGAQKEMSEWVIDTVDHVALMSYRDTAAGIEGVAAAEISYANSLPANHHKIITGVETVAEEDIVTFYQEGTDALEAQLTAVSTHYASAANKDGWGGAFIHHYGGWKALPEKYAMQLAIPSYIYPDMAWNPNSDWTPALSAVAPGGILMINPDSGPGDAVNPDYVSVTAQIKEADILPLGYVSTEYGARSQQVVVSEINKYYDWYQPSGIFFDEAPGTSTCASKKQYYLDLANAVRARDPAAIVVVNPGTETCSSYLSFVDIIVSFEDNVTSYASYTPPAWTFNYPPTRFWHLVHDATPLASLVATAAQRNAGWVYVTDDHYVDDPWDNLATYIAQEAQQVAAVVFPIP